MSIKTFSTLDPRSFDLDTALAQLASHDVLAAAYVRALGKSPAAALTAAKQWVQAERIVTQAGERSRGVHTRMLAALAATPAARTALISSVAALAGRAPDEDPAAARWVIPLLGVLGGAGVAKALTQLVAQDPARLGQVLHALDHAPAANAKLIDHLDIGRPRVARRPATQVEALSLALGFAADMPWDTSVSLTLEGAGKPRAELVLVRSDERPGRWALLGLDDISPTRLAEVPAALAAWARTRGKRWDVAKTAVTSKRHAAQRDVLVAWMFPDAAPSPRPGTPPVDGDGFATLCADLALPLGEAWSAKVVLTSAQNRGYDEPATATFEVEPARRHFRLTVDDVWTPGASPPITSFRRGDGEPHDDEPRALWPGDVPALLRALETRGFAWAWAKAKITCTRKGGAQAIKAWLTSRRAAR